MTSWANDDEFQRKHRANHPEVHGLKPYPPLPDPKAKSKSDDDKGGEKG